ncbi:chemotaxis protein CheW [Dethiosulfatarculus sandiegensis]|uniref:Response regulator receiver n=1 Tax=Dethiosulfatarculus sandiegensis TaxID=1429043 RepID=A0A0D2G6Y7_9BACT|nr:chemotaxis protein CheW [Dethiosulfatarculus sandiegensis]KIX10737.1 response regulator receiver [Dethiosulfatarculus sandiegensis]
MSLDPNMIILLVEDSEIMRKMEIKIINDLGFSNVLEAKDGQDAIDQLKTDQKVDLIISDWNMPIKDGYELLLWVRADAKRKETPFIMATAQGERTQVTKAKEAGISGMVSKPFTSEELQNVMGAAISGEAAENGKTYTRTPQTTADGRLKIKMGHIQITDHLVLGVLKHLADTGHFKPELFTLETECMATWNQVAGSLEKGEVDGSLVLAPIAMDLFSAGVPIKLLLLAHKNGSIFVRNKKGGFQQEKAADFFRDKDFYIPHRLSMHHMLAHMYLKELGLKPGVPGEDGINVCFEVVPPVKMPEFLGQNQDACGFMVAEPIGTKSIAGGIADLQFLSGQVWPGHPCCVVTLREEVIKDHEPAIQEFISLLVEAGKFIKEKPAVAAEIAVSFLDPDGNLGLRQSVLKNVLTEPHGITTHDLFPVKEDLKRMLDYMHHDMGVGQLIDLDKFVDTSFAGKACGYTAPELADTKEPQKGPHTPSPAALAKDAAAKAMLEKEGKYLTFSLDGEEFGLSILRIVEIMGVLPITPVPRVPEFFKGVINLRGKVIPVIDLRLRLGIEETEYTDRTCIIVVETQAPDGLVKSGIVVDSVNEVVNLTAENIEPAPAFGTSLDTSYIMGMAKVDEKVKVLLEIDQVLSEEEMAQAMGF